MKRFTITFFFLCLWVISFAQNVSFMGIPLGTSLNDFKGKLTDKGYAYDDYNSNRGDSHDTYYFDGVFAGSVVTLSVTTTPKSKLVSAVSVGFKDYTTEKEGVTESSINSKYKEIEQSLKNKYTNTEINRWSNGSIIKATSFKGNGWGINLSIQMQTDGIYKGICLLYVDYDTFSKAKKEFEEDY